MTPFCRTFALAIPLLVVVSAALGAPSQPVAQASQEAPVLRISSESHPTSLDWNSPRGSSGRFLTSFLMRGLLKYDANNNIVCDLCSRYEISSDGLVFTFFITPTETWSDGTRLQAQHFVDAFRRILSPKSAVRLPEDLRAIQGSPLKETCRNWDGSKLGVRALASDRLEVRLSRPVTVFSHLLTSARTFPIRKELIKGEDDSGEVHASKAVLGPYQLVAWERDKRIVFEGNPHFRGSRPVFRVEILFGKHDELLDRFRKGKLDILAQPTTEDLVLLSGERVQVNPVWSTRTVLLNTRAGPMANVHLRRALLHTLDRDTLPSFLKNGERRATGLIPPGLLGYRDLPLATIDLARAQAERNLIKPSDRSIEIQAVILDSEGAKKVAKWLSEQLAKIHLHAKIRTEKRTEFNKALESGQYDLAIVSWPFGIATPIEILRSFETDAITNRARWTNVAFDALINLASMERDAEKAAQLIDQATQILEIESVVVIPLGYPTRPYVLGKRVVQFGTTPFGEPDLARIELKP